MSYHEWFVNTQYDIPNFYPSQCMKIKAFSKRQGYYSNSFGYIIILTFKNPLNKYLWDLIVI